MVRADDGDAMMEPDLANTAHMKFVDNRCACCPYGYHIDIDFLRYLESLGRSADGADSVARLQQIHDNKLRLRKSMELFLRQQELDAAAGGRAADDVDLRGTSYDQSAYLQSLMEREDRILENMDGGSTRPKYRTEAALSVSRAAGRDYDSSSSVSVHSGPTSPAPYHHAAVDVMPAAGRQGTGADWRPPPTQNGAHGGTVSMTQQSQQQMTSQSMVTGGGVTDEMETFLVDGVVNPGHPGIPADMTLISSATLQTIREQMAASVKRMKELEDENHALRLLEVGPPAAYCRKTVVDMYVIADVVNYELGRCKIFHVVKVKGKGQFLI